MRIAVDDHCLTMLMLGVEYGEVASKQHNTNLCRCWCSSILHHYVFVYSYSLQQMVSRARSGVRPTVFSVCWWMSLIQSACWTASWRSEKMQSGTSAFALLVYAAVCITFMHLFKVLDFVLVSYSVQLDMCLWRTWFLSLACAIMCLHLIL